MASGFDLPSGAEPPRITQPCANHREGSCAIYLSWRPAVCGRFACRLLRRLESGLITSGEAIAIVERTRQHAAQVRAEIGELLESRPASLHILFNLWRRSAPPGPASSRVELNFMALGLRLDRDFRRKDKDMGSETRDQKQGCR